MQIARKMRLAAFCQRQQIVPSGFRLGLPRRLTLRLPRWVVGCVLALAVVLPLFGASVVVILAAEWLASRGGRWWTRRRAMRADVGSQCLVVTGGGVEQ